MSNAIKEVARDFYLKMLLVENHPLEYSKNRNSYKMRLVADDGQALDLQSLGEAPSVRAGEPMSLSFDYRTINLTFTAKVQDTFEDESHLRHFIVERPFQLYKDLGRSFARVSKPDDMDVRLFYTGTRYVLPLPSLPDRVWLQMEKTLPALQEGKELKLKIASLEKELKARLNGIKLSLFSSKPPVSMEELYIAETGRVLYFPENKSGFPQGLDNEALADEEDFKRHIDTGAAPAAEVLMRYFNNRLNGGYMSEIWVPIRLYDYILGYIHFYISERGFQPMDSAVLDLALDYANAMLSSVMERGAFDSGKRENEEFPAAIVDISLSGLLFTIPRSHLSSWIRVDEKLGARITYQEDVSIDIPMTVVRRLGRDETRSLAPIVSFGCRFDEFSPNDEKTLRRILYGNIANPLQGRV